MATDKPMQLGMVGLGRMGANLVRRLMRDGHQCVVYDVNERRARTRRRGRDRAPARSRISWQAGQAAGRVADAAGGDRADSTLDQLVAAAGARRHR